MISINKTPRSVSANPLALIDRILADIELTETQYKEAKTSYEAVAAVLNKNTALIAQFRPSIFPQGSMRLGTTVRPVGKEKFDLDMICWLAVSGKIVTPEQVYQWVWDALGADETYRHMRRKKNRCIRLEYAESRKFYLDVTPAVPDWVRNGTGLYVPDRELKVWCSSHPKAFADEWFKRIAEKMPDIRIMLVNSKRAEVFSSVEPMPEFGGFEKQPLQRIVQLLKHDRDKAFQNDEAHRPSSILLTTIIAHSYEEVVSTPVTSLFEFVIKVIENMPKYIRSAMVGSCRKFYVMNPVNTEENFAEKWTDEHYKRFLIWHSKLKDSFSQLQTERGWGVDVMLNRLSETFGNEHVIKAANSLGADTDALHQSGKLRLETKHKAASAGMVVPSTIYFGK